MRSQDRALHYSASRGKNGSNLNHVELCDAVFGHGQRQTDPVLFDQHFCLYQAHDDESGCIQYIEYSSRPKTSMFITSRLHSQTYTLTA